MNKKFTLLLVLCLVGSIGIATAAKPQTPSLFDAVAELQAIVANLQTAITDLWGNATQQQTAIENEVGARTGDIQALWANATEQQTAIDNEEIARDTADQALWANATEQQTAIDTIKSGSATQFGDWTDVNLDMESDPSSGQNLGDQFVFNVIYTANTDGFIVAIGDSMKGLTHSDYEMIFTRDDASWKVFGDQGLTMPVKAGDYWEVISPNTFGNIWWIPLIPTT